MTKRITNNESRFTNIRICMFLANNDLLNDSRVQREAEALADAGFDVLVLAQPSDRTHRSEKRSGYRVLRVDQRDAVTQWFDEGLLRWLKNLNKKKFHSRDVHSGSGDIKNTSGGDYFTLNEEQREKIDLKQIENIKRINCFYVLAALKFKPDVCHSHDLDSLLGGILLKEKMGCKLIYDAHELWTEQQTPRTSEWTNYFNGLEKTFIKRADKVITVNESIAEELSKKYGINSPEVLLNCSAYKESQLKKSPDFEKLPPDEKIILYHGAYEKERGLEQLIKSALYIKEAVLVLRGYGSLEKELKNLVKEFSLEQKVFFLKSVDIKNLADYSAGADIGVIPYLDTCLNNRFTTPNKLFEYMTSGLVLATSDLPELRNIVVTNNIGVVFNPSEPKDIADKINLLLSDEGKLEKMKQLSKSLAKTKYNWDIEKEKLIKIYGEIMS